MPHFRKLHVKTVDSLDVNDMSSDFVRLMWVLLPLKCCKEGRGMYHPTWIKSQLFPLRTDVTDDMISSAMQEYHHLGMVDVYEVDGRAYFQIRKWHQYQSTAREAESPYPEPPEDDDNSGSDSTHDKLMSNSGVGNGDSARTSSIYISNSLSSSKSSSRGGMGGISTDDQHEENQLKADVVTAICNVVKGENPIAPSDRLEQIAYKIWEQGAIDRIGGFSDWWLVNGYYNGRPALTSFIQEWDNYLDGVVLTKAKKENHGAAMQAAQEYAELKARFADGTNNN